MTELEKEQLWFLQYIHGCATAEESERLQGAMSDNPATIDDLDPVISEKIFEDACTPGRKKIFLSSWKDSANEDAKKIAKEKLREISRGYEGEQIVEDSVHIDRIKNFAQCAKTHFADILVDHELPFGRSQQIINIFLKHLWCFGIVKILPHCPTNRKLLRNLYQRADPPYAWTKLRNIKEDIKKYECTISRKKSAALEDATLTMWGVDTSQRLAAWELKEFNKIARGDELHLS